MTVPSDTPAGRHRASESGRTEDCEEYLAFSGDITDYWSYTQIRDYLLVMHGLPHTALRLYELLRSMIAEAKKHRPGAGLRRMSIDQLCWLLPGVKDKPVSVSTMYELLAILERLGLVVPNGEIREVEGASRLKGKEKAAKGILRGFTVKDLPPAAYTGWRNAWDKLDAYRPDWRENPPQPPTHLTTFGLASSDGRRVDQVHLSAAFQGRFQKTGTPSTGDDRKDDPFQKTGTPFQETGTAGQKTGTDRALTSQNGAPKEASRRSSSKKGEDSRPSLPDGSGGLADGWTDGSGATKTNPGVDLLLAIGNEKPEFLLTGKTLRDQGLTVAGMLLSGWTQEQLRQVIAGRPLPPPREIKTSVGGLVAGRLRDAMSGPAPSSAPSLPAQAGGRADEPTPVPANWKVKQATVASGAHAECVGDDGMCGRPVVDGTPFCLRCTNQPANAPL
ncbi:hypothetical protein [Streptomyces sp. 2133.1]|uniref:hypothetical protein n=1 Tax=Streptomyces sp. 2133.1 TaxID=1881021 RepID=UPI00089B299F|nr:hypothetical protein [Streptomyces sp. 2133.1]SEE48496.1 hypothetical protein SAMN05428940_7255 [Streptomyces sp. 2133.1]